MVSLENYRKQNFNNAEELILNHGQKIKEIIGKPIQSYWVVWEENSDEWNSDSVIVINIDGKQLEICNSNLDALSITWNQLDTKSDAYSLDLGEYGKFKYKLRERPFEHMNKIVGKKIEDIEIIEYQAESKTVFSQEDSQTIGMKHRNTFLNGIGFKLEDGYFSVFNALDTNGISFERETKEIRYISVKDR